jgi:AcrR family transcriptional regulator
LQASPAKRTNITQDMNPAVKTPPQAPAKAGRGLRADAKRNHEAILVAAKKLFADQGLDAQMPDIAKAAKVGVGTVYRHFPTKDDLIAALLDELLAPLAAARDTALSSDAVLATFLHEAARRQREHLGLVDALRRDPAVAGALSRLREPAIAIVEPIVARAHADGELRAFDVLLTLRMVASALTERHVDVVLRGLRP